MGLAIFVVVVPLPVTALAQAIDAFTLVTGFDEDPTVDSIVAQTPTTLPFVDLFSQFVDGRQVVLFNPTLIFEILVGEAAEAFMEDGA